jgi:hypothetical protein
MHLLQGGPDEMPSSLYPSVSRLSWLSASLHALGSVSLYFLKIAIILKLIIIENDTLQTAEAVLLIAQSRTQVCTSLQLGVETINRDCRSRPQASEQDLPTKRNKTSVVIFFGRSRLGRPATFASALPETGPRQPFQLHTYNQAS